MGMEFELWRQVANGEPEIIKIGTKADIINANKKYLQILKQENNNDTRIWISINLFRTIIKKEVDNE